MTLPAGAPARLAYVDGAVTFAFSSDVPIAGLYRLEASATGYATRTADLVLVGDMVTNFALVP